MSSWAVGRLGGWAGPVDLVFHQPGIVDVAGLGVAAGGGFVGFDEVVAEAGEFFLVALGVAACGGGVGQGAVGFVGLELGLEGLEDVEVALVGGALDLTIHDGFDLLGELVLFFHDGEAEELLGLAHGGSGRVRVGLCEREGGDAEEDREEKMGQKMGSGHAGAPEGVKGWRACRACNYTGSGCG